jgi:hypothetical protein
MIFALTRELLVWSASLLAAGRVASRRLLARKRCILAAQLLPLPYRRVITSR